MNLKERKLEKMSDKEKSKKTGAKKPADHPKFGEMVKAAIVAEKKRNGSSLQAIEKYIKENFKVGETARQHIKLALKRGEANGQFVHTKGVGATGSFKVNKNEDKKTAKKTLPAKKKPAAESVKKAKKPATKRVPAKEKSAAKPAKKEKKSSTKQTTTASKNSKVKKPLVKKTKETKATVRKPASKKVKNASKK